MTTSSSAPAIPVRLLSSVAVVGRDNEPIYLRGDLCDVHVDDAGIVRADGSPPSKAAGGIDDDGVDDEAGAGDGRTRSSPGPGEVRASGGRGGGLLGRIMGRNRNGAAGPGREDAERRRGGTNDENDVRDDDEDDDDDDPFGFFAGSNSTDRRRRGDDDPASSAMSLTQQLVLHASLDRFEEMACRSNRGGGVRWRTPGSNAPNAMWMGLLCRVEERWDVYGYLTNTGIKFMMLVEDVYLDPEDGSRIRGDRPLCGDPPFPSSRNGGIVNREADLKKIFARLHDLYVRHAMNPFSQLRGPVRSRRFDDGITEMARSFNDSALEQVSSSLEGEYGGGWMAKKDGLAWM